MSHKISIAIVTRNRSLSLERTLESLSKQKPLPFEIIISDDSDSDDMIDRNKELAMTYNCKYITGPKKGLYSNRNFASKHCSGTHIRTMDDDHTFPENHIKHCLEAIEKNEEAIWVIGEYYPWDTERPIPAPIPGQLHPRGYSYVPKNMSNYYGISCGASIYPRSIIDNNILNSEAYKFGILYLEYGIRLYKKGYDIRHLDTTYIIHYVEENLDNSIAMAKDKNSLSIINGARVYSMLMYSLHYQKTIKNQLLTSYQIFKDLISGNYSLKTVGYAYKKFRNESK